MTIPLDMPTLIDHLTAAYDDTFEENYVDATTTPHPTNIAKWFQAVLDSIWSEMNADFASLNGSLYLDDMTGGQIDEWAEWLPLNRRAGESDASFIVRIKAGILRKLGGTTPDEIVGYIATSLGAERSDIELFENDSDESGDGYDPADFHINISQTLMDALGVPESERAALLDDLSTIVDDASAAGVVGEVRFITDATYDVAQYDVDVYG